MGIVSVMNPGQRDALQITACTSQGGRRYMEDNISIVYRRNKSTGDLDFVYVGVFDGHGGYNASAFAKYYLLDNIQKQPGFQSTDDAEILNAIKEGFRETHNQMRKEVDKWPRTASGFTSTAGTTASIAFIKNGKIYSGHVGDSGIMLGERIRHTRNNVEIVTTRVTVDHKPDSPDELRRIVSAGGEVQNKAGVFRVVWARPRKGHQGPIRRSTPLDRIPFLAVARSLGDLWSYNTELDTFIVSPEPDLRVIKIEPTHACLVFGSDGLWNVVQPETAVELVTSYDFSEEPQNRRLPVPNHSRLLISHALARWGNLRADNISAVVVLFNREVREWDAALKAERVIDKLAGVEDALFDGDAFDADPDMMLHLTKKEALLIRTDPVDLTYSGQMDGDPPPEAYEPGVDRTAANFFAPLLRSESPTSQSPGVALSAYAELPVVVADEQAKVQARTEETTKPKYWCRKHGILCEKAKQMNAEYERAQAAKRVQQTTSIGFSSKNDNNGGAKENEPLALTASNEAASTQAISSLETPTKRDAVSMASVAAESEASASKRQKMSLRELDALVQSTGVGSAHSYETRASTSRVTRSGTKLGSAATLRSKRQRRSFPLESLRARRRHTGFLRLPYATRLTRRPLHSGKPRLLPLRSSISAILKAKAKQASSAAAKSAVSSSSSNSQQRSLSSVKSFSNGSSTSTAAGAIAHSSAFSRQLSDLRSDIAKSVHKFRLKKLKHCFKEHQLSPVFASPLGTAAVEARCSSSASSGSGAALNGRHATLNRGTKRLVSVSNFAINGLRRSSRVLRNSPMTTSKLSCPAALSSVDDLSASNSSSRSSSNGKSANSSNNNNNSSSFFSTDGNCTSPERVFDILNLENGLVKLASPEFSLKGLLGSPDALATRPRPSNGVHGAMSFIAAAASASCSFLHCAFSPSKNLAAVTAATKVDAACVGVDASATKLKFSLDRCGAATFADAHGEIFGKSASGTPKSFLNGRKRKLALDDDLLVYHRSSAKHAKLRNGFTESHF